MKTKSRSDGSVYLVLLSEVHCGRHPSKKGYELPLGRGCGLSRGRGRGQGEVHNLFGLGHPDVAPLSFFNNGYKIDTAIWDLIAYYPPDPWLSTLDLKIN